MSEAASKSRGQTAQVEAAALLITQQTAALQEEVQFFLAAMRDASGDRRRYERHDVTAAVTLRVGGRDTPGSLSDISLGGCAITTQLICAEGTELGLILPGAAEPVQARVAHANQGTIGIFFRQDDATRRLVGAAIDRLMPVLPKAA
jgi:hypothetical protein